MSPSVKGKLQQVKNFVCLALCYIPSTSTGTGIQQAVDEKLQEKAWGAVVPLVGKLKKFYEFSQRLGKLKVL